MPHFTVVENGTGKLKGYSRWNTPLYDAESQYVVETPREPDLENERWDAENNELRPLNEEESLAISQRAKITAIDARSDELFTLGLQLSGGPTLSLSVAAQLNYGELYTQFIAQALTYPVKLSTMEGGEATIANALEFGQFATQYEARKREILDGGRALRLQVLAASTVAEVEAVVDSRS